MKMIQISNSGGRNQKMKKSIIISIILAVFGAGHVFSSAWVKPRGGYYFKLSANYMLTNQEFNHKGEKISYLGNDLVFSDTRFRDINIYLYYEYGITNRITIWGDLVYKSYTSTRTISTVYATTEEIATTTGFADMRLLAVYGIMLEPVALSFALGPKIPMGYSQEPENDGPKLGTGYVDLESYLSVGTSLYPVPAYVSSSIGYRVRGGQFNDEMYLSVEAGYTIGSFFFKAFAEFIRSTVTPPDLYGGTIISPLPGGGGTLPTIYAGDQDISKILPSVTYYFNSGFGIQAEINHVFAGKNTLAGTTYSLGIVFSN
jgi:hypothetical protein